MTVETRTRSDAPTAETPFPELYASAAVGEEPQPGEAAVPETPFLSEYLVGEEVVSESAGSFRELLSELYDAEFDETLRELVDETDAHAQLLGYDETSSDHVRVERALGQWMEPLRMEAEALLESMATALDGREPRLMTEAEVDELLDGFEPRETTVEPAFEDFLKKLWKKAKSVAKGAVKLAKKGIAAVGKLLPIGLILKKIKALVRPLLQRVLKIALNRLPVALRPAAKQLASRLFGLKEAVEEQLEADDETETPASADVRTLQEEFDTEVATLLLAPAEPTQEAMLAEFAAETERADNPSLADLDRSRETFVARLGELREGEDPTPVVEQFLPAVLPLLRMGIKIIGRPKVVKFLAKLLGRLIAPYVGARLTPPLSQAIVDAGLRLMTLETGEEETGEPRIAAEAFAGLLEDTLLAVSELDEGELDDEAIVEEVAIEGFHRAAGAHFPASVLARKGAGLPGTWIPMPRRRARRYRKYSRVANVLIRPGAAARIRTRGGRSLATFLQDRVGQVGPVRARMHLYQAIPGTRLGAIVRAERGVRGLGPTAREAVDELHPLTMEAATALLGEPELGQDVSEAFLEEAGPLAVGQRFYYLEVAGGRPAATAGGTAARPRLSETTATVDLGRKRITVAIYLAEAQAQAVAARLRRGEPIGASLRTLRPIYAAAVKSLVSRAGQRRVRIVGETEAEPAGEEFVAVRGLRPPTGVIAKVLIRWTRRVIAAALIRQRDEFVAAASAPNDGVTLVVTIDAPPGLAAIAPLLRGRLAANRSAIEALRTLSRTTQAPKGALEIVPGYRRA